MAIGQTSYIQHAVIDENKLIIVEADLKEKVELSSIISGDGLRAWTRETPLLEGKRVLSEVGEAIHEVGKELIPEHCDEKLYGLLGLFTQTLVLRVEYKDKAMYVSN